MIKLIDILKESDSESKSLKDMQPEEIDRVNDEIYGVVSDWVISSMSDTEKRQQLAQRLEKIEIPVEYKRVSGDELYRAKTKNAPETKQRYVSYSEDLTGAEKMRSWLIKIFGTKKEDVEIVKIPVEKANVLISIPSFLRLSKKSSGRRFDALWKTEKEVIIRMA